MTTIKQAYYLFMKDVISFCKTACGKYQIPVLLLSTKNMAAGILRDFILIDPAPPVLTLPDTIKQALDWVLVKERLKKLRGCPLYINDKSRFSEEDLLCMDTRGAKIVFIDDSSNVPSFTFLENWAKERDLQVILRNEQL